MRASKWIRVRPLKVSDFTFIRRIASKQGGFTVPPLYVLWLLSRTNSRNCMIVEHVKFGPVAYLLSILVCRRRKKLLYIWQLAGSKQGARTGAIDLALLGLRTFVHRANVDQLFFTMDPEPTQYRAIRRCAYALSRKGIRAKRFLPRAISRTEREFMISVR